MKKIRRIAVVTFTLLVCFIFVPVALAHPLGNFTINQYAGLQISRDAVVLDYVLDMAEIPAFQEISLFDSNGNGQADSAEAAVTMRRNAIRSNQTSTCSSTKKHWA